jgi:hypothetical protein
MTAIEIRPHPWGWKVFEAWGVPWVVAPALLRLDPIWDPLRSYPAFQKLCQEKQS